MRHPDANTSELQDVHLHQDTFHGSFVPPDSASLFFFCNLLSLLRFPAALAFSDTSIGA